MILIVDDDRAVLETTRRVLERNGLKTITASNGAEAVSMYEQNKDQISVVLLDMMMPVMDGAAALEALRKINPAVKIIAVTGFAKESRFEKAIEKTQAYLTKPFTMHEILATIRKVQQLA